MFFFLIWFLKNKLCFKFGFKKNHNIKYLYFFIFNKSKKIMFKIKQKNIITFLEKKNNIMVKCYF